LHTDTAREVNELMKLGEESRRFMMPYKFAIDKTMTKINMLNEDLGHDRSPIEHVSSRLKSPESIRAKARRKGCALSGDQIRENILDIAGIRVTCSFISDTSRVCDMLTRQNDVTVLEIKDYIRNPKPNGYQSLHVIVQIPVSMADRVEQVAVEVQIRTVAMDFWASLEHKISYKYESDVPEPLLDELKQAALAANRLDVQMEQIHDEVINYQQGAATDDPCPGPSPAIHVPEAFPRSSPRGKTSSTGSDTTSRPITGRITNGGRVYCRQDIA
jgi:putative GTP pyrophosphokinase